MVDQGAGAQVAHPCLDKAAFVAGRAMLCLKNGEQFPVKVNYHPRA
jgi:hypothetical protein